MNARGDARRIVVLGGTGDLAVRHLLPAVALLHQSGFLHPDLDIVAIGREGHSTAEYRRLLAPHLSTGDTQVDPGSSDWLLRRSEYRQVDLGDDAAADRCLSETLSRGPALCYLALPPVLHEPTLRSLGRAARPGAVDLVVEKPVGIDRASAARIDSCARTMVESDRVFRADHFLHHQAVRDVLTLSRSCHQDGAGWNRETVSAVEIVWEEAAPAGGRVELFDRLGTLRDMVQSHLLQLLALVALEPPSASRERALSTARLEVLRAVSAPDTGRADSFLARGRYTAGQHAGGPVEAYADHDGVEASRRTETYVSARLVLDVERWRGVPFVLRTGKAVGAPRRFVSLRTPGEPGAPDGGQVILDLSDPGRLVVHGEPPGSASMPPPSSDVTSSGGAELRLPATARLLHDVLAGRQTMFPSAAEVDQCWRVTEALRQVLDEVPLQEYRAGGAPPPSQF